jgi:hypothetical protein
MLIRWSQGDIDFLASYFGIPEKDIPSEATVWTKQRARRIASAAFIIEAPLLEPLK